MYIQLSLSDATRLNELLYSHYVYANGEFIPPYEAGTTAYIDVNAQVYWWDSLMEFSMTDPNISSDDQAWLASLKASATETNPLIDPDTLNEI